MGLKEQLQKDKANLSAKPVNQAHNDNTESEEADSIFWGWERSPNRRAVMLDLRLKNGKFVSLPYSYMTRIKFDPSEALELFIAGNYVKITGRNMNEIYNYLCRHRVTYIAANITDFDTADANEIFIKDIVVTEEH